MVDIKTAKNYYKTIIRKKYETVYRTDIHRVVDNHQKSMFNNTTQKEKHNVLWLGGIMVMLGILCMIAATLIVFKDPSQNLLLSFLIIFLEPAAWFLLWEGMNQIIFNSKDINPELEFYKKMASSNMHIFFKTY